MRLALKDVAELAGVSKAAVSMYLNGDPRGRISEAKRKLIDKAVKELGYRPSHTAKTLRSGRSDTLGLIVGDIVNEFFARFAQACHYYCEQNGFQLMLGLTSWGAEKELRCLQNLLEHQVDGIIYTPSLLGHEESDRQFLHSWQTPIMLMNQPGGEFLSCERNFDIAYEQMAGFLKERGIRSVFSVSFHDTGYLQTMAESAGLRYRRYVQKVNRTAEIVPVILRERPEAVYCADCMFAGLLLKEIDALGLDYAPAIITAYNFPVDYLADRRVVGLVFHDFYSSIRIAMTNLISAVNGTLPEQERHSTVRSYFYSREEFERIRSELVDTLEKSIKQRGKDNE